LDGFKKGGKQFTSHVLSISEKFDRCGINFLLKPFY